MSYWIYSKDRRELYAIDVPIMVVVFIVGLAVASLFPIACSLTWTNQRKHDEVHLDSDIHWPPR